MTTTYGQISQFNLMGFSSCQFVTNLFREERTIRITMTLSLSNFARWGSWSNATIHVQKRPANVRNCSPMIHRGAGRCRKKTGEQQKTHWNHCFFWLVKGWRLMSVWRFFLGSQSQHRLLFYTFTRIRRWDVKAFLPASLAEGFAHDSF